MRAHDREGICELEPWRMSRSHGLGGHGRPMPSSGLLGLRPRDWSPQPSFDQVFSLEVWQSRQLYAASRPAPSAQRPGGQAAQGDGGCGRAEAGLQAGGAKEADGSKGKGRPSERPEFKIRGFHGLSEYLNGGLARALSGAGRQGAQPRLLISGPSGSGKTFCAEEIARQAGFSNIKRVGGNELNQFIHCGIKGFSKFFEDAAKEQPCAVMVENIDTLFMSRETLRDYNDWTAEEISAFTQGLDSKGTMSPRILVICTTCDEGKVDSSVTSRLPFRFRLGDPDRRDIESICSGILGGEVDGRILDLLEGRSASAVARFANAVLDDEDGDECEALEDDAGKIPFDRCIGVLNRLDGFTLEGGKPFFLAGQHAFTEHVNSEILPFLSNPAESRRMKVGFPSSMVLYGKPGCGKSYAAKALGRYLGWKVITMDSKDFSQGQSIARVFKQARGSAPCVVIIDEIDAICGDRRSSGEYNTSLCEEFLRVLDRAADDRILVVATTNYLDRIDEAILRPGRLGTHIEIKPLGKEDALEFAKAAFEGIPVGEGFSIEAAARLIEGRTAAEASAIFERSRAFAVIEGTHCVTNAQVERAAREHGEKGGRAEGRHMRVGFI